MKTKVGYSGGTKVNPTYHSLGDHTETTEIYYNPKETSYEDLIKVFWNNHDPTSKCSRQYMSAIFYFDDHQKKIAELSLKEAQKTKARQISTKILPAKEFYNAEDYHQKYMLQRHSRVCNALDVDPGTEMINSYLATRINGYIGGYGTPTNFDKESENWDIPKPIIEYIRKQLIASFRGSC